MPGSMGVAEVVITKSQFERPPETAVCVSSEASTFTSTLVATKRLPNGLVRDMTTSTKVPFVSVLIALFGTMTL